MSEAPKTPAYFGDDEIGSEHGMARWLVDSFAGVPDIYSEWFVDGDTAETPFQVALLVHEPGRRTVLGIGCGAIAGEVSFAPDPSGYVLVTGSNGGKELFRAYLDRPYEDFDLWPAGAVFDPKRVVDAPCRIGKRRSWMVLDTRVWPGLAKLANGAGYLMVRTKD